jgi:hypothetical protein
MLPYLLGFLFSIFATIICHYALVDIELGKLDTHIDSKTLLFNKLITFLGFNGIWIVGILILGYIGTKIYNRFKYPPIQIKLVPPSA